MIFNRHSKAPCSSYRGEKRMAVKEDKWGESTVQEEHGNWYR